MSTLERAIQIAATAHAGQVDKAGEPYIFHPLKVMLRVEGAAERIAAVLHDVVEDTTVTFEDLAKEGFSQQVLEAVRALTKRPGETRMAAAGRAAQNKVALAVKLGDNAENLDLARIPNPTPKDYARLEEYKAVRALLVAAQVGETARNPNHLNSDFQARSIAASPRFVFKESASYFDVEGIPVSIDAGPPAPYCAAWDTLPPRPFDSGSARRNGTPIALERFWAMVADVSP
jgi:guanosine-3',5'-bis(diphosphate) 3'-pyrophosphohydrolase